MVRAADRRRFWCLISFSDLRFAIVFASRPGMPTCLPASLSLAFLEQELLSAALNLAHMPGALLQMDARTCAHARICCLIAYYVGHNSADHGYIGPNYMTLPDRRAL